MDSKRSKRPAQRRAKIVPQATPANRPPNGGYGMPIIELLGSAATFGDDFERIGRLGHLRETVENASHLQASATEVLRLLTRLGKTAENRGEVKAAVAWLKELHRDFEEIAGKAHVQLLSLSKAPPEFWQ